MNGVLAASAVLGLVFGGLAALAAFLITYQEYAHHYPDWRVPRRLAAQAGVVAFVVFFTLALLAGVLLSRMR